MHGLKCTVVPRECQPGESKSSIAAIISSMRRRKAARPAMTPERGGLSPSEGQQMVIIGSLLSEASIRAIGKSKSTIRVFIPSLLSHLTSSAIPLATSQSPHPALEGGRWDSPAFPRGYARGESGRAHRSLLCCASCPPSKPSSLPSRESRGTSRGSLRSPECRECVRSPGEGRHGRRKIVPAATAPREREGW